MKKIFDFYADPKFGVVKLNMNKELIGLKKNISGQVFAIANYGFLNITRTDIYRQTR